MAQWTKVLAMRAWRSEYDLQTLRSWMERIEFTKCPLASSHVLWQICLSHTLVL